ncbi:hypothetical protein [Anaerococcus hydrogenalis]|uniref:Lipoprotein n=1 Tax=Anaerococcus hydrogenalis TaxID=33029 RepID=A0A2N6UI27_9FIRM|nr:hypothetical protein [Anaerococcus hydrogenalis]MDK7695312.1 hypothetical protein [Anaerococcus hydrogenalis]MDK7697071.1 hypothetical protein [Anaerococcus hydrogenalis]MDK7708408.1 hypothetical protein [Anaerococcus hydrogenalis]PMC81232.1 hypothetical protein CJ192_06860 [Anaerococcus hydrogenalis]
MKKKLTLIFAMSLLLSSCGGSMVKVNQGEIAKNKAELEAKNQKREIEGLEEDKPDEKKSKKDKNKKKIKLEEDNKKDKKTKKDKKEKDSDKKLVKNNNKNKKDSEPTRNNNTNTKRNNDTNNNKGVNNNSPRENKEEENNSQNQNTQNKSYVSFKNPDTSNNSGNYPEVLRDLNGKKFVFSSGAGGWQTVLNFSQDGNFTAKFEDYDLDSVAICEFNGKLSIDSKVNETAYILRLDRAEITTPINTQEVKNIGGKDMTVRYVDLPYGFAVNNDTDHSFQGMFSLYLPLRKRSDMSAEVNHWLDITGEKNVEKDISRIYLLVNNKTIDTFREKVE